MAGIIVGIDGSVNSHPALDWALREAGVHHAPLIVLTVHEVATNAWTGNPMILPEDQDEVEKVRHKAEETAAHAAAQIDGPAPASITVRATIGLAARELIEASRDADLLVVGARGGGGFARLVMGSVSLQVVQHADCPTVVVPSRR